MTFGPRLRKLTLTAHVTSSVGWLGAVVAYLALAVTALTSQDVDRAQAGYLSMELIGWYVILPLALAALASGLVQSLGTEWGLVRHYWVVTKLVLTVVGTAVLLGHLPAISQMAELAARPAAEAGRLPVQLVVHAAGGLAILLGATVLSIYKPWGRIRRSRSEP